MALQSSTAVLALQLGMVFCSQNVELLGVPLFNHLWVYILMYLKTKLDHLIPAGPVVKCCYGNIEGSAS